MGRIKRLFCVVDKTQGQEHSFVDGMLRSVVPNFCDDVTIIFAGAGKEEAFFCSGRPKILVSPFRRKGGYRVLHAIYSVFSFRQAKRVEGERVLVRNELLALAGFCLYRALSGRKFEIFFQNSFPHENLYGKAIFRPLVKLLFRVLIPRCDRILVVDDGAVSRISGYGARSEIAVIPLCTDFEPSVGVRKGDGPVTFIYVGTVAAVRQLGVVIRAFAALAELDFKLVIAGADEEGLKRATEATGAIESLLQANKLHVLGFMPRGEVRIAIGAADVGINLIPPTDIFRESSSTKLGEYLSQGVPVLSSKGIPYHHRMHGLSNIGWLVDFDEVSITQCVRNILTSPRSKIDMMREACLQVHKEKLSYLTYVDALLS